MNYYYDHGMMGGDAFGFGLNLIVLLVIVLGIIALVRHLSRTGAGHFSKQTALDILKERYAKGELSKKEFEEIKKDLAD